MKRARIVLLTADGVGTSEIVQRVETSKPTGITWRNRYLAEGLAGLDDRDKPGRPAQIRRRTPAPRHRRSENIIYAILDVRQRRQSAEYLRSTQIVRDNRLPV